MSQISQIKKIYHAAIYVRLSKEDGAVASHEKTESNSIANQKSLIRDFLENKNDIEVVQEYVDDGFSGSNFERPAFQMMLEDIKKGKIDCVVTKDLSRFGREYIDSGMYIERLFPAMGVRFIAINDGIDSGEAKSQSDEIIIPFKNLINDAYCRDISIKIRSHLEIKRKQGDVITAFVPYGYKKNDKDKHKLEIDVYAANVVKDIFRMKLHGKSQDAIACELNSSGILPPAEYKASTGSNYQTCFKTKEKSEWTSVMVRRILTNEVSANSFGSTGGMSVALKNLVNALYCKDASKKVRAAKAVLAKQGKYIAAFAPFGYQKSEDDKHMLVPDPVTAPVVQLIFELAIKGMKYTEIANYLNNNGYDSIFEYYQKIGVKRCYERDIGEHMWSASTVMEILYNEVYIGSVINNKTADNIDTGHQVVQRDKEDWIIVENCHEPLVSVEDFKLAHKMIARREVTKRKPNGKWRKSYIRCGICGKGLYKYGNKSSYRCHNGHVSRIRGEELEATLLDIARNMALAQLQEFELKTDGGNCPDNLEREIESLKKSKAHYAKLKFEIYDDYTKTNITRDQMAKKTAEVKQKIAEIESLITEKQETLDMQKDLFLDAKQEQLTKLSKLDEFDEEVIRYLIDYVLVYDNEHIEIRWNFDDFQAG